MATPHFANGVAFFCLVIDMIFDVVLLCVSLALAVVYLEMRKSEE